MGAYDRYDKARQAYDEAKEKYTGTQGYKQSLQTAKEGAQQISEAQAQNAMNMARQAGMSKGASATIGAQTASQNYGNNIANQQNMATQQGQNALGANVQQMANAQNQINQGWDATGKLVNIGGEAVKTALSLSDERLKEIYGIDDDSKLESIKRVMLCDFKYTPEAQEKFGEEFHVDDEPHEGVMAQDIENVVPSAVKNVDGKKVVDTKELVMALTGIVAELARKLDEKEDK